MEPDAIEQSWAAWYLKYAPPQPADEFPKSVTVTPQQIDRAARKTTLDAYRAALEASPREELVEAAEAYMEGHPCPLIDNHGGACFQTHQLKAALSALRTTKEGRG